MAKKAARKTEAVSKPAAKKLELANIGPIPSLAITFADYGITILRGANGAGKSHALATASALAKGEGRLPLRDGEQRGYAEGFGARITIGGTCRHTGEFEVQNLEGRFDLARLCDPGLKDVAAADRARIQALVTLSGIKADPKLFREHQSFADSYGSVVGADYRPGDDLVELASTVRKKYHEEARHAEEKAATLNGEADGFKKAADSIEGVEAGDVAALQEAHRQAEQRVVELKERRRVYAGNTSTLHELEKALKELVKSDREHLYASELGKLEQEWSKKESEATDEIAQLRNRLAQAEANLETIRTEKRHANERYQAAMEREQQVGNLKKRIEKAKEELAGDVTETELHAAEKLATLAQEKLLAAQRFQDAEGHRQQWEAKRKAANAQSNIADKYRRAADAVDDVLSEAIRSPVLRVVNKDGTARLMTDHPQRGETPFHELSDGEKWRIALSIGADQVGEGGLLVVPQTAWEGLDTFVRPELHAYAQQRKVYVLTAEATRDVEDGKELFAVPFREE